MIQPGSCLDEQPVESPNQTRKPIPIARDLSARVEQEDGRAGTASIFMIGEPL